MTLLRLEHVTLQVPVPYGSRRILRDVTLEVAEREAVGLVGESGSGKSMTLRTILGTTPAGSVTGGCVEFDGDDLMSEDGTPLGRLRGHRIGVIGQDPQAAINPVYTVGSFLLEGLVNGQGQPRKAALATIRELLQMVGLTDQDRVLAAYPHQLSGGMLQRVSIAAALAEQPQLLLADEPTTALDVTTQSEVMAIIDDLRRDEGLAMLFVTHDLELASAVCDRIAVMYAGEIVEIATPEELRNGPHHPYTRLLMDARPRIDAASTHLSVIPGRPAGAHEVGAGCAFAPRCPWVEELCLTQRIELRAQGPRWARCRRAEEIASGLAGPYRGSSAEGHSDD